MAYQNSVSFKYYGSTVIQELSALERKQEKKNEAHPGVTAYAIGLDIGHGSDRTVAAVGHWRDGIFVVDLMKVVDNEDDEALRRRIERRWGSRPDEFSAVFHVKHKEAPMIDTRYVKVPVHVTGLNDVKYAWGEVTYAGDSIVQAKVQISSDSFQIVQLQKPVEYYDIEAGP